MRTRRSRRNQDDQTIDVRDILNTISEKLDIIGDSLQQILNHNNEANKTQQETLQSVVKCMSKSKKM